MSKKVCLIVSIIMAVFAVIFIAYAFTHPEGSFPWSNSVTYTIYFVYIAVMASFFGLSRK